METPNLLSGVGTERKIGQMVEQAGLKIQELRDTQQMLLGESYVADMRKEALDFETKLQYDKEYYTGDIKLKGLQQKSEDFKKKYQDKVKELGYDEDFMNAYIEKAGEVYNTANSKFLAKHTAYIEEKTKNNFLMLQDTETQNSFRYMLNGEKDYAVNSYKNISENTIYGVEKGYITGAKAIDSINKNKVGLIESELYSYVNQENGKEELLKLGKMNFQEFKEYYKDLEIQVGDYDIKLGLDDFEAFQKNINTNLKRIETREKANEEKTFADRLKAEAEARKNPVKTVAKTLPYDVPINQYIGEVATAATNLYYGKNYKDEKEMRLYGDRPITIDSSNTLKDYYNDPNMTGIDMIGTRMQEAERYVGGVDDELFKTDVLDNQYDNGSTKYGFGARIIELSKNPQSRTYNTIATLYNPENKRFLTNEKIGKTNLNTISNFEQWEEFYSRQPYGTYGGSGSYGASYLTGTNTSLEPTTTYQRERYRSNFSTVGKLQAFEFAGRNGDFRRGKIAKDGETILEDTTKVVVRELTGGIVDEDAAKAIGIKESGMLIEELDLSKVAPFFQYQLEKEEVRNEVLQRAEPMLKELMAGQTAVDLGYGRYIVIDDKYDENKVARSISQYTKTHKLGYIGEDGKVKLVTEKNIVPETRLGNDSIIFTYRGLPLMELEQTEEGANGEYAVLKLGDDTK